MSLRSDKDYLYLVMPIAVKEKKKINNPTVVFGQHPHDP